MFCPSDFTPYPWMEFAYQELGAGVREIAGPRTNANIAAYLAVVGLGTAGDETPWCSAFANWCMIQAGIGGSGRPNARSWLSWGGMCLAAPRYGAVSVLWRGSKSGWQGHVGFYVGSQSNKILLLGGNQGNSVSLASYSRDRVLGYRWPQGFELPDIM
jgi:uncharacterized protein (TIGR02594 family)